MLTFDIEVKLKNKWAGTVTVEIPKHHERLTNIAKFGAHKMVGGENADNFMETTIPILGKVYSECAAKLVQKIDLKGPGGQVCNSMEEMDTMGELQDVWLLIALQYVNGYGPGKKKSQS